MPIVIEQLTYRYGGIEPAGRRKKRDLSETAFAAEAALTDVSLTIREGEFLGIIGIPAPASPRSCSSWPGCSRPRPAA